LTMSMSQPFPIPNVWIRMLSFFVLDFLITASRSDTYPSVSMKTRVSLWPVDSLSMAFVNGARIFVSPMFAYMSLI